MIKNKAKMVFFRRFLGYVIYQWKISNAPHTHFTVIFLDLNYYYLRQLVICDTVPLIDVINWFHHILTKIHLINIKNRQMNIEM